MVIKWWHIVDFKSWDRLIQLETSDSICFCLALPPLGHLWALCWKLRWRAKRRMCWCGQWYPVWRIRRFWTLPKNLEIETILGGHTHTLCILVFFPKVYEIKRSAVLGQEQLGVAENHCVTELIGKKTHWYFLRQGELAGLPGVFLVYELGAWLTVVWPWWLRYRDWLAYGAPIWSCNSYMPNVNPGSVNPFSV